MWAWSSTCLTVSPSSLGAPTFTFPVTYYKQSAYYRTWNKVKAQQMFTTAILIFVFYDSLFHGQQKGSSHMPTGAKCKWPWPLIQEQRWGGSCLVWMQNRKRQHTFTIPSSDNTFPFSSMEIKPQKEEMWFDKLKMEPQVNSRHNFQWCHLKIKYSFLPVIATKCQWLLPVVPKRLL